MDAVALRQAAEIADPLQRAVALTRLMSEDHGLAARAAAYRRHAIAQALEVHPREQVALALGVSPPRITQLRQGPAVAPEPFGEEQPRVLVQRAVPSAPQDRASVSLFLAEAERQGVRAGREMLYVGPEPASAHVASCLRIDEGAEVIARRKVFTADDVRVRRRPGQGD